MNGLIIRRRLLYHWAIQTWTIKTVKKNLLFNFGIKKTKMQVRMSYSLATTRWKRRRLIIRQFNEEKKLRDSNPRPLCQVKLDRIRYHWAILTCLSKTLKKLLLIIILTFSILFTYYSLNLSSKWWNTRKKLDWTCARKHVLTRLARLYVHTSWFLSFLFSILVSSIWTSNRKRKKKARKRVLTDSAFFVAKNLYILHQLLPI